MSETTNTGCPKCGIAVEITAPHGTRYRCRSVTLAESDEIAAEFQQSDWCKDRCKLAERAEAAERERDGARISREYAESRLMQYGEQHNAEVNRLLEKIAELEAKISELEAELARLRADNIWMLNTWKRERDQFARERDEAFVEAKALRDVAERFERERDEAQAIVKGVVDALPRSKRDAIPFSSVVREVQEALSSLRERAEAVERARSEDFFIDGQDPDRLRRSRGRMEGGC